MAEPKQSGRRRTAKTVLFLCLKASFKEACAGNLPRTEAVDETPVVPKGCCESGGLTEEDGSVRLTFWDRVLDLKVGKEWRGVVRVK